MRRPDFKVLGAFVSAFNVAVPLVLDAHGLFPDWPWQVHALIGFVGFVVFMVWIVQDLHHRITQLEGIRPIPCLRMWLANNQAYLEIENKGEYASFKAMAEIVEGDRCGELYDLVWHPTAKLNKNDKAQILLAEMQQGGKFVTFCGTLRKETALTQAAIDEHKLKERYPKSYSEMSHGIEPPEDRHILEITISSNPSALKPLERKRYLLGKDKDGNLLFTEVELTSHKEGSLSQ
jgi:hypothetical protein